MRAVARLLLIALLAVLLPLKGMAAGGFMPMVPVGSNGHHHGYGHEQSHGHEGAHAGGHGCHEADAAAPAIDAGPEAGTCKHCAPCCAAVAPMRVLSFAGPAVEPTQLPAAEPTRWAPVALALPDRPPRSSRA